MDKKKRCLVTDKISEEGCKIGYMYREGSYNMFDDSGWRFFEGSEDEEYMSNPENSTAYTLEDVIKMDESILPYLDSEEGSSFYKDENGNFIKENSEDDY